MRRHHVVVAVGAALAVGTVAFAVETLHPVAAAATAAALAGCGVAAWRVRPSSRVGPLLCLAAAGWVGGGIVPALVLVHRVPLVYVVVSYPSGRLHRWPGGVAVAATVLAALVPVVARNDAATLLTAGLVAVAAVDATVHARGPSRRARAPALGAGIAYAAVLSLAALSRIAGWGHVEYWRVAYDAVVAAIAVALLAGLLAGRWTETVIADLVVELGDLTGTGTLRERLAAAVGDPSLVLAYWTEDEGRYVDDAGRPVAVPALGSGRSATTVDGGDGPMAVLVHDDGIADDPRLVASVVAAVRLAVANARMHAEVRARVAQLTASRRRIVEAADGERRRLARSLHDGVDRRLATVGSLLAAAGRAGQVGDHLPPVEQALRDAREELRRFAAGVRPPALTEGGLAAALPVLAERCPVPVDLSVGVERLDPAVEGALYFACAEGLANVAKHAGASRASVRIDAAGTVVTARIGDDGTGGASPGGGSGLRGLSDRIEALGGTFHIDSPASGGTRLTITVPGHGPEPSGDAPDGGVLVAAGPDAGDGGMA